jgi:hypothetical protein
LDDKVAKKVAEIVAALPPAEPGKDAVLPDIEAIVAEHIKALSESLPVAKDGISPELPDIAAMVSEAVAPVIEEVKAAIADIKDGEPGKDGNPGSSVTLDDVLPILTAELKSLIDALPPSEPGKDGESPVLPDIEEMVQKAVDAKKIKVQKQASSEIVAEILPALKDELKSLVSEIPRGEDGVSPELPDIKSMVSEAVTEVTSSALASIDERLSGIKDGEPGKSVEIDDVLPTLMDEMKSLVSAIPVPKNGEDGKSVDPEELAVIVESAVAKAIPAPVEPDLSTLEPVLADLVHKAVAAIPAPVDGSSVTVEDITPVLVDLVEKAVAALPVAKDGVGLADAMINNDGEFIVTMTDGRHRSLGKAIGKSEPAPIPDFSDIYVGDDIAELTSKAIRLMVETPAIQPDTADIKSMPTINITVPVTTPKPGKKQTTVTKWTADGLAEQMVSEELDVEGA